MIVLKRRTADKVRELYEKDSEMMHEFSRRSLHHMHPDSVLSAALTFFPSYMEGNVKKEVDKDHIIIEEAARAFESGRPACDLDLEEIFDKTKTVDKAFLDGLAIPSFTISVHYSDFADIRINRIWRIARTVYTLLPKWPEGGTFCEAARSCYTEKEFEEIVREILELYTMETGMLGSSIRSPFHKAIASYLASLVRSMESVKDGLAAQYAGAVFGDKHVHA